MTRPTFLVFFNVLLALLLAGCATSESRPGPESVPQVDVEARTKLPVRSGFQDLDNDDGLVATDLRAGVGDDLVEVRSRYSMASGELVQNVGARYQAGDALPTQLARQSLEHSVRLSTPGRLGPPLRLGFDQAENSVLTVNGQQRAESTRAHLAWSPEPVELQMEWTPPREVAVAGDPFDCMLEGRLQVPTENVYPGLVSTVGMSRSDCRVDAPGRGVQGLPLQVSGIAWRWGEDSGSGMHMNRFSLHTPPYLMSVDHDLDYTGYELGLTQQHSFMGWRVEAEMAVRQAETAGTGQTAAERDRWAMDLQLSRHLRAFALTARWMQSHDPLWFLPAASPVGRESRSLLLDFSHWLSELMPGMNPGLKASWQHSEDAEGRDDNRFLWDFSLSW